MFLAGLFVFMWMASVLTVLNIMLLIIGACAEETKTVCPTLTQIAVWYCGFDGES